MTKNYWFMDITWPFENSYLVHCICCQQLTHVYFQILKIFLFSIHVDGIFENSLPPICRFSDRQPRVHQFFPNSSLSIKPQKRKLTSPDSSKVFPKFISYIYIYYKHFEFLLVHKSEIVWTNIFRMGSEKWFFFFFCSFEWSKRNFRRWFNSVYR